MKKILKSVILTVLVLLMSLVLQLRLAAEAQPEKTGVVTADEYAEFKQLVAEYCEAWSTQNGKLNFDKPAQFYAKDADLIFYDPLPPLNGYNSWYDLKTNLPWYDGRFSSMEFKPNNDLRVWHHGNIAWTTFTFHISAKPKIGKTKELDGRETAIWEKRDGRWMNVHENLSLPLSLNKLQSKQRADGVGTAAGRLTEDTNFKQLMDNYWSAWSTGKTDIAVPFYAKDLDLVFYTPFLPLSGYVSWKQLESGLQKFFTNVESAQFSPYSDLHTWHRDDIVWTTGTFHQSIKFKNRKQYEGDARYSLIWEKRNGKWSIVHEHLSAVPLG
jgi:ketosteroid isomerase-like protein